MNIGKYIFAQVIDFIPRYQFDKFNNRAILSHQYYFEFTPVAAMYEGEELEYNELESIGISRYVQYSVLNNR